MKKKKGGGDFPNKRSVSALMLTGGFFHLYRTLFQDTGTFSLPLKSSYDYSDCFYYCRVLLKCRFVPTYRYVENLPRAGTVRATASYFLCKLDTVPLKTYTT